MLYIICTVSLAGALVLGANEGHLSADTGTCPAVGCDVAAAFAPALMQQVQQVQEQITKVVASESTSTQSRALLEGHSADHKLRLAGGSRSKRLAQKRLGAPSYPRVKAEPGLLPMLQTSSEHRGMARLAYKAAPTAHARLRGWTAPLDEAGYRAVADLKSDDDMEMFIRRVIDAYDSRIINQGGFMSIVPWFSGATAVQSFEKLQETLLYAVIQEHSPWLVYRNTDGTTGSNAELSFMGYVEVAATRKQAEMVNFARRVCKKLSVQISDEAGFLSMVKHFIAADDFQTYDKLEHEISSAANAPHSWGVWKDSGQH